MKNNEWFQYRGKRDFDDLYNFVKKGWETSKFQGKLPKRVLGLENVKK